MMKYSMFMLLMLSVAFNATTVSGQLPKGVSVKKIWDGGVHNAFTDLIRFNGQFYCSFREGSGHVPGTDGTVRILSSKDGRDWQSAATLETKGIDLRDPKLSVTPDGRLMVIVGGSIYENGKLKGRSPQVSFSDKSGKTFSATQKVNIDPSIVSWGDWIWRVTWHNGIGYAIDYQIGPDERNGPTAMYLLKTTDGINFTNVHKFEIDGFPNEATVRFDKDDLMYVMIRRETADKVGMIATSAAPFKDWKIAKMTQRIGGPNFIVNKDKTIIAGTRLYEPAAYTAVLVGDASGKLEEILHLPSSGDNSYPGMVIHKKNLLFSYYSSHEGKTSIYLAKIPMSYIRKKLTETSR